jgi:hypothetical protein
MFENYSVAVKISLVNHVSAGLLLLTQQFASTDAAAAKLQKRMDSIKGMAKGGAYLLGGAGALAAPFIFAIDKAAELQKQMIAIQLATRGSVGEMDKMRGAIEGIAAQTIFSNIDVAKMGKLIATGTGLKADQVTSLLPTFGKFADVQSLMKGTPFEQSTNTLVRLAHLAGHFDAPGLSKYADLLTKASLIVPGGLGEVAGALQYSQGVAKTALGVDDNNAVLLVSLLNRLGLKGSRGGTNAIAAMTRTIPGIFGSGLLKGKSNEALLAMGMTDPQGHSKVFKDGKFDVVTWMGLMGEYVQKEFASHPEAIARQDIMKNFQHAFGVQGSRVATLFSSPQAIEQFRLIGKSFSEAGGAGSMQKTFADQSVAQQWTNAKTNFISALTELGMTLLPMASNALKLLNTEMGAVVQWITKHQHATKILAVSFLSLSAAMAFGGTVLLLTAAFRGLWLVLQFGTLGGAGQLLGLAKGFTAIGGGLGSLIGLLGKAGLAGAAAAAGFGIGKLINSLGPDGDLGGWIGSRLYDLTHPNEGAPDAHGFVPRRKGGGSADHWADDAGSPFVKPGSGRPVTVHTQINMDGRKVADAVTSHQARSLSAPLGGANFDGSLTPATVVLNQAH